MFAYASVEDFVLRVGELEAIQLTDREHTGEINQRILSVALADSASQIDGYLAGRYPLPLASVPQNLVRICCDLARYRLASMSETAISEEVIERYRLTLKELEYIANGKVSLGIETQDSQEKLESNVMFSNPKNKVFSRDNPH